MNRGFTLIELMIAIAVLSIFSVSVGSFPTTFDHRGSLRRETQMAESARRALFAEAERIRATPFDELMERAEGEGTEADSRFPGIRTRSDMTPLSPRLLSVRLSASWQSRDERRAIEMVTLRGDHGW